MDAKQITNIISGTSGFYGLRALCDDEKYAPGDEPRESYNWDYENDISTYRTDGSTIGGVCTVGIDTNWDDEIEKNVETALGQISRYIGNHSGKVALIRADHMDYGNDDGEDILYGNPVVIAVWEVE